MAVAAYSAAEITAAAKMIQESKVSFAPADYWDEILKGSKTFPDG